jgi:hypothetical protein
VQNYEHGINLIYNFIRIRKFMTIAFIHPHKAFLPEIQAYTSFFQSMGVETETIYPNQVSKIRPDLEWHFMGTHLRRKNSLAVVIHEYASLSVPPSRKIKDGFKNST